MAQSNSRRSIILLDRAALFGLGLGLALYVMPFWNEGRLRWSFWVTLVSAILHIYTSHKRSGGAPP